MKLSWAAQALHFSQKNSNLEEFFILVKNYFEISQLTFFEVSNTVAVSTENTSFSFNIPLNSILNNKDTNFCKVSELSATEKTFLKEFNGILKFYENYSLKFLITFKGKVKPAELYAHIFPYLNNLLKIEQAEKTVQEDFLCRINHELKTPLNSIMGQLNILADDTSTANNIYISGAQKSAKELLNRIDNLLIYARYTDEFVSNPTTFNVNALIQEAVSGFDHLITEKALKIHCELPSTATEIFSDPYYIKRIINSLIENACTFTEKGSIKITSKVNNDKLEIQVIDSGIGFNSDLISLIQKKAFVQAESYQTRSQKGTGISLNLCFKIAKNLGGEILISSEKNKGSIVTVVLPITKHQELKVNKFYGKALIVEDDINNQLVAKKYLQKLGFDVDVANHGKEALDLVNTNRYTFILMDCQMPVMDGFEATMKIKEKDPNQIVIACTAHALNEAKQRCIASGMNAFLTKPLDQSKLKKIIYEQIPECADNFDESIPSEIILSDDELKEGINFLEHSLLATFKNRINEDFKAIEIGLPDENLRKTFHRLKSTYGQLGFIKSQSNFSILQKATEFEPDTLTKVKKQTKADIIALEQWISKQKEKICA